MKSIFTLFLISLFSFSVPVDSGEQFPWQLRKEKNGIKVFTRDLANSNLKELKIEMAFNNTTIPEILKVIMDSNTYTDWVFKCSEANEVEAISEFEDVSYYKFDFPWPFSDRDAYMKSTLSIDDQKTKATINTRIVSGFPPPKKDVVRMINHSNQWQFQQVNAKKVSLTYFAKSDPAGSIPDWIVNMAVDRGPTETLSNLRKLIREQ